jgi:tetratricopeptide (TPR) repeat protein
MSADQSATGRFVRSAWVIILLQLAAAALAFAVTAWAAFHVQPLLEQSARLERDIKQQTEALSKLKRENEEVSAQLARSRETTEYVTMGINAFHARSYKSAVGYYDRAIALDDQNPYVFDLKGYALFRGGDWEGAITALKRAIELKADYMFGYLDLAKAQCGGGLYPDAAATFAAGMAVNPNLKSLFSIDGELRRVCAAASLPLD